MSRSLAQWVEYIQTLHARTIDLGLERVARVWDRFKPESLPAVITIAGTNGKGSSVAMLESIYRHAGYKTGAFTSPHLVHFNERICINNQMVSDERLLTSFEVIESIRGDIALTYFEFNTLLALDIFCQANLDIILLEVGMGGRLDSTNIIDNDLALITAIGLDHMAWLGDNKEAIGFEKAGIIKPTGRVVIADPDAPKSIERFAKQQKAKIVCAEHDYHLQSGAGNSLTFATDHATLRQYKGLNLKTNLIHQQYNQAGVIASVAMMQSFLPVSPKQLKQGLASYTVPARLQLIDSQPKILLDVSHNEASILAMTEFIDNLTIEGELHAVFGALTDKDNTLAYQQLKQSVDYWYLASLEGERGQTAISLSRKIVDADGVGVPLQYFETPVRAFEQAKLAAQEKDLIVIFGSFHLVGAIIEFLQS